VRNYKLTIQYDGTNYSGWQTQPQVRTIQSELTRVLSLLDHRPATVHGAGRTDAGVHALGQVATVNLERELGVEELMDAVNGNLDREIRVVQVEQVDSSFHARFSAKSKTYRYRVCTAHVVSPFEYRYVHHYRGPLDAGGMKKAAEVLLGRHDFSAFTVLNSESEDFVRNMTRLDVDELPGEIQITAQADGFLRFMVRAIVGTLLEIGRGRLPAAQLNAILLSGDRSNAGPTAPAHGLTLMRVDY
jgi:tRNA pseudouridine38-40 synthase